MPLVGARVGASTMNGQKGGMFNHEVYPRTRQKIIALVRSALSTVSFFLLSVETDNGRR